MAKRRGVSSDIPVYRQKVFNELRKLNTTCSTLKKPAYTAVYVHLPEMIRVRRDSVVHHTQCLGHVCRRVNDLN